MNKGIQSKSSLVTFWCVFRLMFERCTKYKIDKVLDRRRTSNVCVLRFHHSLSPITDPSWC